MPETTEPEVMTTAVRARRAWTRVADRARAAPKTTGHAISDEIFEAEVAAELDALSARMAEQHAVELATVQGDLASQVAQLNERLANVQGDLARTKAALREALGGRTPVLGPKVVATREQLLARVHEIGAPNQAWIVAAREDAIDQLIRYGWTEDRARIVRLASISLEPYATSADAETP